MGNLSDLYTLTRLLKEFDLPVSPILEYAIREKLESLGGNIDDYQNMSVNHFDNISQSLRVEFLDGTIICEADPVDTLERTISIIGPHLVEILCFSEEMLRPNDIDLVSKTKCSDKRYVPYLRLMDNGYYLFTKSSLEAQKQQLEIISKALSLNLIVEVV